MHTRRAFLLAAGAGLWTLTGTRGWAQAAANPTPTDIVKQFLAARAAKDSAKAYALLSADAQQQIPFAQFTDAKMFPAAMAHAADDGVSPLMAADTIFFMDTHNAMGYTFTVVGSDPTNPHTVLVNALPPTQNAGGQAAASTSPYLLRVVTAPNTQGMPRIEMLPTYRRTSSADFDKMLEKGQQVGSVSNLRQIATSMIMYAQDHTEHMPDADQWMDVFARYWHVSDSGQMMSYMHDPAAPDGQTFSYAFNRSLSGISLSKIAQPAETVLLFTSMLGTKNAADTGQSLPRPGWHSGGNIVAFADGHVKWVKDGTALEFKP